MASAAASSKWPASTIRPESSNSPTGLIQFDGPWHIAFYGEVPTLRLGRDNDIVLVVGTPGVGSGTFAMLDYDKAIPDGLRPIADVRYPGPKAGGEQLKELYELKERC